MDNKKLNFSIFEGKIGYVIVILLLMILCLCMPTKTIITPSPVGIEVTPNVAVNVQSATPDVIIEPQINILTNVPKDVPRYNEEMVRAIMRDYDFPWMPIKSLEIEHHGGRIWYVYATFQNTTRLYIFDEPL